MKKFLSFGGGRGRKKGKESSSGEPPKKRRGDDLGDRASSAPTSWDDAWVDPTDRDEALLANIVEKWNRDVPVIARQIAKDLPRLVDGTRIRLLHVGHGYVSDCEHCFDHGALQEMRFLNALSTLLEEAEVARDDDGPMDWSEVTQGPLEHWMTHQDGFIQSRAFAVLRLINQGTIAPAITELIMSLGGITKDVPRTWKIDVTREICRNTRPSALSDTRARSDGVERGDGDGGGTVILVKHRKQTQGIRDPFVLHWELSISLDLSSASPMDWGVRRAAFRIIGVKDDCEHDVSDRLMSTIRPFLSKPLYNILSSHASESTGDVDMSNSALEDLPEQLYHAGGPCGLLAERNLLHAIPTQFRLLDNLERLYLTDNLFNHIPDALLQLKNLRCLGMGGNRLTTVPDGITRLAHLDQLLLSYNLLESLPKGLFDLPLTVLRLDNNKFSEVPEPMLDMLDNKLCDEDGAEGTHRHGIKVLTFHNNDAFTSDISKRLEEALSPITLDS